MNFTNAVKGDVTPISPFARAAGLWWGDYYAARAENRLKFGIIPGRANGGAAGEEA